MLQKITYASLGRHSPDRHGTEFIGPVHIWPLELQTTRRSRSLDRLIVTMALASTSRRGRCRDGRYQKMPPADPA